MSPFPLFWSNSSPDVNRAAQVFFDIDDQRGREYALQTFIETMIEAEIARIGPCSERDAFENVAAQVFAHIVRRCGGGKITRPGRVEAERIFRKLAAPIKRDLMRMQTRFLRELYDDYVLQRRWPLLKLAKTFASNGRSVTTIDKQLRRFQKDDQAKSTRRGRSARSKAKKAGKARNAR